MSRHHRSDLDLAVQEGLQRITEARIKNGNRVCWCSHELYKHKPVHGECQQPGCACELFIDNLTVSGPEVTGIVSDVPTSSQPSAKNGQK